MVPHGTDSPNEKTTKNNCRNKYKYNFEKESSVSAVKINDREYEGSGSDWDWECLVLSDHEDTWFHFRRKVGSFHEKTTAKISKFTKMLN